MAVDAQQPSGGPGVRGWLSELLFPTVLGGPGAVAPLAKRMGGRSTLDLPLLGRSAGMPDVEVALGKLAEWLAERHATYALHKVIVGTDRDVAEGTIAVTAEGTPTAVLPVAVVAERRRSREVELRVYHALAPLGVERPAREATVRDPAPVPSPPVLAQSHFAALRRGDAAATLACFETDAVLVDSRGLRYGKADGGIAAYYAERAGLGEEGGGIDLTPHGYADDGRTCAIELTRTRLRGADVPHTSLLAVYDRGDSGLFRELRLYEDAP